MLLLWKQTEQCILTIASKTLDAIAQITRSPITALKPLQNAHVLNVHSAFSSVLPCSRASCYPCKGINSI
jgi:hypothetical protein